MARNKLIGGVAEVRYGGETLLFRGELKWNFQQYFKKTVAGRDGKIHGHTREPNVAYIEGKFTFDGAKTTKDLEAIEGAIVTVRLGDGRMLVLRDSVVAGEITPGGDEGEVTLRFEGAEGEELSA